MTPPPEAATPRAQCYHAIRHLFSGAMAAYVLKNPLLLQDMPRLEAANYSLVKLMEAVLAKLDEFAIEPPAPEEAP